jgi:uroporphyrinogen III methyltransferase/synthase
MTRVRKSVGRVTFVGSGPGDPGLISLAALDALRAAEVVHIDPIVPTAVRALVPLEVEVREADPADAGKAALTDARNGSEVVRLVGGDPFGSEAVAREALAVSRASVPFSVVPGLDVGTTTATYAGIALGPVRTEVDLRPGFVGTVDWDALAHLPGSIVVTVDAADLPSAAEQLVAGGSKPDTAASTPPWGRWGRSSWPRRACPARWS